MKHLVITIILGALLTTPVGATELSYAGHLRKLSLSLRGVNPSETEYSKIANLPNEDAKIFLDTKIREYLGTDQHVGKMEQRLEELFRVALPNVFWPTSSKGWEAPGTSLNHIFRRIIKSNLSWDSLLTTQMYNVQTSKEDDFYEVVGDVQFFSAVFPEQLKSTENENDSGSSWRTAEESVSTSIEISAKSESQKLVTGGAISTPRFFERYPTTKVNKNRKRAAALFRIFLCDDMKPIVLPSATDDAELLATGLGSNSSENVTHDIAVQEKRHGSDPQCKSCHYKLDPAANTFRTSSVALNPTPAPGGLVYTRPNGSFVNLPAAGLGELAQHMTQQKEYAQCQVKHFWNWFIGSDVNLSDKKLEILASKFDEVGRRPNDFIFYLVGLPEFINTPTARGGDVTVTDVKPLFQKCHQCHQAMNFPAFYDVPISGGTSQNEYWLSSVASRLDLDHDGQNATMPPKNAGWAPSPYERALIKKWIADGAKNIAGTPTITASAAKSIITTPVEFKKQVAVPTMNDTFFRYLENFDFFKVLAQYFGDQSILLCSYIEVSDKNLLGFNSPIAGKPIFSMPSPAYIGFVQSCALASIEHHYSRLMSNQQPDGSLVFFEKPQAMENQSLSLPESPVHRQWSALDLEDQKSMVKFITEQLHPAEVIGVEALSEMVEKNLVAINEYVSSLEDNKTNPSINSGTVLQWIALMAVVDEKFLVF